MMGLQGKWAIVTGGASGIGKAIVERFAEAGAAGIVSADVSDKACEVAERISHRHACDIHAVQTDVSDPASVAAMAEDSLSRFQRIDILVNNAGICPIVPWDEATLEDWNRILAVNLTGMFLCTKAIVPQMRAQGYGRIVYLTSTAASVGSLAAHVAYGVSKAGAVALMKSVAKGFAAFGITANAVSPGTTDTPLTDSFGPELASAFVANCVLKRKGDAGEVADAVLFLVSERATYITGHVLDADGGFALR